MAITGLGIGGPARAYATFADKAATATPASRLTRMILGGPGFYAGDFTDKEEADPTTQASMNYPIYSRTRKRR